MGRADLPNDFGYRGDEMPRIGYAGRPTCEECKSIDVRGREGHLNPGQLFSVAWTRGGEPSGRLFARTEADAVILIFQAAAGGKLAQQRVPITWTACHFGGRRPWFVCPRCSRRVAILYSPGGPFLCRLCRNLAYASQQEPVQFRGITEAQKIRARLGGSADLRQPFPDKPARMHWRTYLRLRNRAEAAVASSSGLITQWITRLRRA
jgi:hypothetical protein